MFKMCSQACSRLKIGMSRQAACVTACAASALALAFAWRSIVRRRAARARTEALSSIIRSVPALADLDVDVLGEDAASLGALLAQQGRSAFLAEMRRRGLELVHRSALADALGRELSSGRLARDETLPAHFEAAIARMPPLVRQLLENGDPSAVSARELLAALHRDDATACEPSEVMELPAVLSRRACARLRAAVECDRRLCDDSVDGGPEHQLNLSVEQLGLLIGRDEAARLMRLPAEFRRRSALALRELPSEGSARADEVRSRAFEVQSREEVQSRATEVRSRATDVRARVASLRAAALERKRCGDRDGAMELLEQMNQVDST